MSARKGGLEQPRQPLVPVDHELVAGKHFFTAATAFGQGLCVAHGDLGMAFDEVGRQLQAILSQNHRLELAGAGEPLCGLEDLRTALGTACGGSAQARPSRLEVDLAAWVLRSARP